jgi:hypothetical protein
VSASGDPSNQLLGVFLMVSGIQVEWTFGKCLSPCGTNKERNLFFI